MPGNLDWNSTKLPGWSPRCTGWCLASSCTALWQTWHGPQQLPLSAHTSYTINTITSQVRSFCASSHLAPKMQRAIPDRPRHVPQNASCCRGAQGRFIFSRRWGTSYEVSKRWHGRTSFASLEYWRRNGRYTSTRWTATSTSWKVQVRSAWATPQRGQCHSMLTL